MAEFHAEPGEHRERVDDEAAAVTRVVIAFLGARSYLCRTIDTNQVTDPFVFPQL